MTEAVKDSLRESIVRQRVRQTDVQRVTRIAQNIASRPVLDPRTPDEILDYNNFGVPE